MNEADTNKSILHWKRAVLPVCYVYELFQLGIRIWAQQFDKSVTDSDPMYGNL